MSSELNHARNEVCKEEFNRIHDYMKTGVTFREAVVKHEQQLTTMDKTIMELKESISQLDEKVDARLTALNQSLMNLTSMVDKLASATNSHAAEKIKCDKEQEILRSKVEITLKSLDDRLRNIEFWRWFVIGGFAVVMFMIEKVLR